MAQRVQNISRRKRRFTQKYLKRHNGAGRSEEAIINQFIPWTAYVEHV